MYPQIMGILNYTPDSFSDGGKYFDPALAAEHAADMVNQGADIIDIGCNSTGPGIKIISYEEELERLESVLPAVIDSVEVPVSVDTFYAECAEYSLKNGAKIINDVSGIFNTRIAGLVMQYDADYIVMHNCGGADKTGNYPDGVVSAVNSFFDYCIGESIKIGMPSERLILDPGFGFGKSHEDNYILLKNIGDIKHKGFRLLAGISRKRFIREGSPENADFATCAADTYAVLSGADIIRVHNVFAASELRRVINGIRGK